MATLKDNEIRMINDIILELYNTDTRESMERKFLELISALIPYKMSNFCVKTDRTTENLLDHEVVFVGAEDEIIPEFTKSVEPSKNYIKNMFVYQNSFVYVDSDVLDNEIRKNTEFYKEFLEPKETPYCAGIILLKSGTNLGVINLFRGEELGDFTEKEVFILDLFKNHLTAIISGYIAPENIEEPVFYPGTNESLTKREMEIIPMIISGYSNDEISGELCITLSTTKKHVYNIFRKYNVNSRSELIKKLHNL